MTMKKSWHSAQHKQTAAVPEAVCDGSLKQKIMRNSDRILGIILRPENSEQS